MHEWSNEDVLEWMVAIHLHPYLNIIKEQQIRGMDLKHVDEQYLKVNHWNVKKYSESCQRSKMELFAKIVNG